MEATQTAREGMEFTDHCKFCLEMGDKVWPCVCADCFALAQEGAGWIEIAKQWPDTGKPVLLCVNDGKPDPVAKGWLMPSGEWEVDLPRGIAHDFKPVWWQYPPKAPEGINLLAHRLDHLGEHLRLHASQTLEIFRLAVFYLSVSHSRQFYPSLMKEVVNSRAKVGQINRVKVGH